MGGKMTKKEKKELSRDHEVLLNLCDRKLKSEKPGALMAATVLLLEARKVRCRIERA